MFLNFYQIVKIITLYTTQYPQAKKQLEAYVSYLDRKFQAKNLNVTSLFNSDQQSKFTNKLTNMLEHLPF